MVDADNLLPLTPRVFLLLWALEQEGPMHGYALLQRIEERGAGQVTIGPASLYEAIQTLHDRGLVEPTAPPADAEPDRRRRYFRLTRSGRDVLQTEARRLAELVDRLREDGLVASLKAR